MATAKNLKPTALYIEWEDAVASNGWEDHHKAELHPCVTMGFLIDETKDALLIASTISMGSTNARMHIPKAWIKKRKVIKYEDKQRKGQRKVAPAVGSKPNQE